MILLDAYALSPGACRICRSAAHLPVVDMEQDIDENGYEGRFYICVECATQLGDVVGMISAVRNDKREREMTRLRKQLKNTQDQFEAARTFVAEAFAPTNDEDLEEAG